MARSEHSATWLRASPGFAPYDDCGLIILRVDNAGGN
jgi:hypothetical protein